MTIDPKTLETIVEVGCILLFWVLFFLLLWFSERRSRILKIEHRLSVIERFLVENMDDFDDNTSTHVDNTSRPVTIYKTIKTYEIPGNKELDELDELDEIEELLKKLEDED